MTVGGALAADVHGKNHHVDGTIGRHVEELTLLTSSGETLRCSPGENAEAFDATIGGMGLTGVILSARLRLLPVETPLVRVVKRRAKNLDELLARLEEEERLSRYSVAWVDGLARGRSLGRGVLMRGDHVPLAELPRGRSPRGELPESAGPSVPFDAPPFVLGPLSIAAFNALYYAAGRDGTSFSGFGSFFFPLDALGAWNRLYGRRGFVQYQALLPREAAAEGCRRLLEEISRERAASFLAVLKTTGPEGRGLLSFPRPGVTLGLDVPNIGERLRPLARRLDEIVLEVRRTPLPRQGLPDRRRHLRGDVPAARGVPRGAEPPRPARPLLLRPGAPPRPRGGAGDGKRPRRRRGLDPGAGPRRGARPPRARPRPRRARRRRGGADRGRPRAPLRRPGRRARLRRAGRRRDGRPRAARGVGAPGRARRRRRRLRRDARPGGGRARRQPPASR